MRVAISCNNTLCDLPNGSDNLAVYVTYASGNTGVSENVHFEVDVPESSPETIVITSIASLDVAGRSCRLLQEI